MNIIFLYIFEENNNYTKSLLNYCINLFFSRELYDKSLNKVIIYCNNVSENILSFLNKQQNTEIIDVTSEHKYDYVVEQNIRRYFYYKEYIMNNYTDINNIVSCDIDILFQDNPFSFDINGLHVYSEKTYFPGFHEASQNLDWIKKISNKDNNLIDFLCENKKEILCAGVIISNKEQFVVFLDNFCDLINNKFIDKKLSNKESKERLFGCDQGFLNYFYYSNLNNNKIIKSLLYEGEVLHTYGYELDLYFDKHICFNSNNMLSYKRNVFKIAHHVKLYDVFPRKSSEYLLFEWLSNRKNLYKEFIKRYIKIKET